MRLTQEWLKQTEGRRLALSRKSVSSLVGWLVGWSAAPNTNGSYCVRRLRDNPLDGPCWNRYCAGNSDTICRTFVHELKLTKSTAIPIGPGETTGTILGIRHRQETKILGVTLATSTGETVRLSWMSVTQGTKLSGAWDLSSNVMSSFSWNSGIWHRFFPFRRTWREL